MYIIFISLLLIALVNCKEYSDCLRRSFVLYENPITDILVDVNDLKYGNLLTFNNPLYKNLKKGSKPIGYDNGFCVTTIVKNNIEYGYECTWTNFIRQDIVGNLLADDTSYDFNHAKICKGQITVQGIRSIHI